MLLAEARQEHQSWLAFGQVVVTPIAKQAGSPRASLQASQQHRPELQKHPVLQPPGSHGIPASWHLEHLAAAPAVGLVLEQRRCWLVLCPMNEFCGDRLWNHWRMILQALDSAGIRVARVAGAGPPPLNGPMRGVETVRCLYQTVATAVNQELDCWPWQV